MNDSTLRALEFDRVVNAVRSFSLTPLGFSALSTLLPQTNPRVVKTALAATSEGVSYLKANGPVVIDCPADLEDIVAGLAVEDRILEAKQLRIFATFLASLDTVCTALKKASGGPYPYLKTVVDGARSFKNEAHHIHTTIDAQGHVVDTATPQLRTIRERLSKQRQRLRSTFESYISRRETARYLQEQVVSERGGRFVLIVRSEHRSAIPGIVHGNSGSGASLFLEPLSTVEINNDIVALEEEETVEVRRILLKLGNALRKRALDLHRTLGTATEIDVIQARANFSLLIAGVEPSVAPTTHLKLSRARHPLLIDEVRVRAGISTPSQANTRTEEPVPVDICIEPPTAALIVTGPNTGGKTVALKTAGLLVMMAQAGLHIPTGTDSSVPIFRTIFADIGDDQSLSTSLSTFSGHIANIVAMDKQMVLPSLVLLDEVGSGTDPTEGGALGAAVIDYFRKRGALVVATTHEDTVKSYAATTDGVTCAGFGFDGKTYAPTYQLTYGSPGRSLALEIAATLGMSTTIIDDARTRKSAREVQLTDHLAKLEGDIKSLSVERVSLTETKEALARDRAKIDARQQVVSEREEAAHKQLKQSIEGEVQQARRTIASIIDSLRKKTVGVADRVATSTADQPRLSTGDVGMLKRHALDELELVRVAHSHNRPKISDIDTVQSKSQKLDSSPPTIGDRVRVKSLSLDGTLLAIHDLDAEVESSGKRIRVPTNDLCTIDAPRHTPSGGITLDITSTDSLPFEINLIGCRVDDALSRLEKYVDHAILHEHRELRVVHGHGTGKLRKAIADYLEEHPAVAKFALALPEHGGDGVTVIELKN